MTLIEIINLIISILSLLATIAISFVIYSLEKRNSMKRQVHQTKEAARRFIVENAEERGYLPFAVIASGCFPQNKHCRKIYNDFTLLEDEVKLEVLKQAGMNILLIHDDKWIDNKIQLIKDSAEELGLGDTFLYDGAKYFHRLYEHKEQEYSDGINGYWNRNYEDVFGMERIKIFENSGKICFERYLDDYLYVKFEKPEDFSQTWRKPFDYMREIMDIRGTDDEGLVCCWVSYIIENTIGFANKYLQYRVDGYIGTDSLPKTYEDRYFQILYKLYFFKKM